MKYYISGYSGFIGQALVRYLNTDNVKKIMRGASVERLREYITDADVIINLAAYGNHYNQKDFLKMVDVNVNSLYRLLEATKEMDVKFYNVSTSSVYLKRKTFYSITKNCGENLAAIYGAINIRPYSVFGEGEADYKFIPTVIRCLKTGRQMTVDEDAAHDWIYVDDFISAMLNGHHEIGTGKKTTNIEVIRKLEYISGKKLNYICGSMREYDCDDWVAPTGVRAMSLYDGLKRVYDYYRKH